MPQEYSNLKDWSNTIFFPPLLTMCQYLNADFKSKKAGLIWMMEYNLSFIPIWR